LSTPSSAVSISAMNRPALASVPGAGWVMPKVLLVAVAALLRAAFLH
jgi:hypothetical protein